tara:strand:- start:121 stop:480 length:360 start_codon:yes stop_codon:yes gene_type:complete
MLYTKQKALYSLKPDKSWSWSGDSYSGLKYNGGDTAPTESEINAELTRLTNAEPMRLLRLERNKRLSTCDWRASSDLTLPDAWKTYRQSLRDLPASSNPKVDGNGNLDMTSVTFPTEPN